MNKLSVNTTCLFLKLWHHINPRRRLQFLMLLSLMILTSFTEIVSIGAVIPFLGVLTSPDRVYDYAITQSIIHALGIESNEQLLLALALFFGIAAIISGGFRLILIWATTRISYSIGADLSTNIYRRTLYQPYEIHISRNSSEIIDGVIGKTNSTTNSVLMLINLFSSTLILIGILITFLSIEPIITLFTFGGFIAIYLFIIMITRQRLHINSERMARESSNVIKSLQEGLGGIRDILINGSQSLYCSIYRDADLPLRHAQGTNSFISASPRFAIEALGLVIISTAAYFIAQDNNGVVKAIPVIGAFALGAQRLLPMLQQAYAAWTTILGLRTSLKDTLDLLDQKLPDYAEQPAAKPISFNTSISLQNLSFRYINNDSWVLRNLNIDIAKGSRLGFIGATGSGKSTLLDIVMGLLRPTEGILAIDGVPIIESNNRAWQAHIAHVPQSIFLADKTIEENIAFGVPRDQIDHERARIAAQSAKISEDIESWPQKYETIVGERGVRLSGGQRQRIGIARALYKQADVIIFDEATSSLDNDTESAVIQSIEGLSTDLTILIVAHRLTTLKNCTQIIELGDGGIQRIGNFKDIISQAT